jgi:hypothetical protein
LDYSAIPLEVVELKAGKDGWSFSAYASTFGNLDHTGDVILAGAFDDTLVRRDFRPLLWQHDMHEPIGIERSLKPDGKGLLGDWELIDTQRGSDAYKLLKRGAIRAMSIGYIPEVVEFDASGVRIIKQIDLIENSVVSIPANEAAQVQSVKALDTAVPFENLIAQIKGYLSFGLDEAAALFDRRRAEYRAPTEAHIDALNALLEELKGAQERAEGLLHADDEPTLVKAAEALSLRLELARRRARRAGVEI